MELSELLAQYWQLALAAIIFFSALYWNQWALRGQMKGAMETAKEHDGKIQELEKKLIKVEADTSGNLRRIDQKLDMVISSLDTISKSVAGKH